MYVFSIVVRVLSDDRYHLWKCPEDYQFLGITRGLQAFIQDESPPETRTTGELKQSDFNGALWPLLNWGYKGVA